MLWKSAILINKVKDAYIARCSKDGHPRLDRMQAQRFALANKSSLRCVDNFYIVSL